MPSFRTRGVTRPGSFAKTKIVERQYGRASATQASGLLTPLRHATDSLCKYGGISLELVLQKLSYLASLYKYLWRNSCQKLHACQHNGAICLFLCFRAGIRLRDLWQGGRSLQMCELGTYQKRVRRVNTFSPSLRLLIYAKYKILCSVATPVTLWCLDTQVLTHVYVCILVFLFTRQCSLARGYLRFRGTCCHLL